MIAHCLKANIKKKKRKKKKPTLQMLFPCSNKLTVQSLKTDSILIQSCQSHVTRERETQFYVHLVHA